MLNKIFGSDLNLKRPCFEKAPSTTIDFSGTKLAFSDPTHTSMFPINDVPEDMDIYNKSDLTEQEDGSYSDRFYVKGWDLQGKYNKALGGVKVSGLLLHYPNETSTLNVFDKIHFQNKVLEFCHLSWGWMNDGATLGSLGSGNKKYPINPEELKYVKFNSLMWCHFTSTVKDKPPIVLYATPISASHIIFLEFTISTYGAIKFHKSDKSNIKQASYQVIEDFMNNFHIELSDTPKKEQEAASEKLTA